MNTYAKPPGGRGAFRRSQDWIVLEMAARSFAKKRHLKRHPNWLDTFQSRFTRLRFFHFGQK